MSVPSTVCILILELSYLSWNTVRPALMAPCQLNKQSLKGFVLIRNKNLMITIVLSLLLLLLESRMNAWQSRLTACLLTCYGGR